MAEKTKIVQVQSEQSVVTPVEPTAAEVSVVTDPAISPTGFFKGFEYKAPEYSVLTPQTLFNFTLRTLTVEEEEKLKGSMITPRKIPEHLNACLWNNIVKKPASIKTLDDFLKMTTLRDREALVYALYHVTYKDIQNYEITCSSCNSVYPISVNVSKIFSMDAWPGTEGEILNKFVRVQLPVATNVRAIIAQPTLWDDQHLHDDLLFQSDKNLELGTEMMVVKYFEVETTKGEVVKIEGRENIFRGYRSLAAADRKFISKSYVENFGKFKINLRVISTCTQCANQDESPLDLVRQLFRSLY